MACANGARPKPSAPALVTIGGVALTALLCARAPALCPWISAVGALLMDTADECTPDPPPLPEWTAADVAGLVSGQSTVKLYETVRHYMWFEYCECINETTPPPTVFVPPQPMPVLQPGLEAPCGVGEVSFTATVIGSEVLPTPGNGNTNNNYNAIPAGATHARVTAQIVELAPGFPTVTRRFVTNTTSFDGETGGPGLSDAVLNEAVRNVTFVEPLPTGAQMYVVAARFNEPFGPVPTGEVLSYKIEFFCGAPPGAGQPACCPPDMSLVSLLDNILLKVNLLVARAGPDEPLEQLLSTPVSGEGQLALELGTRMVMLRTTIVGPDVQLVPYANPDRAMRLGTLRFGNDFGWQRRQHVDSLACEFPVPNDVQVVSWSLSPGSSGELVQLGAPR